MEEKKQIGGDHYLKCGIMPTTYIRANNLDFFEGNIIKYATRHKEKGGAEDIKKVIHYAEMILEDVYGILPEAKIKENGDVVMEERESSASQESLLPEASMTIEDAIKALRARLRREGRTEKEIDIIWGRK
jgi:hypothetical protein